MPVGDELLATRYIAVISKSMDSNMQRFRWLSTPLPDGGSRRLVVLTGARQTGKTTLARAQYPASPYLNLDEIELRDQLRQLPTRRWGDAVGDAVLDEAQKEPTVFDKVKFAYDAGDITFTLLLGSSRIMLMKRVTETLAGRAFIYELWPLMPSELLQAAAAGPPARPLLDRLLDHEPSEVLGSELPVLLGEQDLIRREAIDHLAQWGGMPELLRLDEAQRRRWLLSYQQAWIERDLRDLANLPDIEAFRRLQRVAMLRCGGLLNHAELGRDARVSAPTVRSYLGWLYLGFQVIELQPFARNLTSSVVKAPKLYWTDLGLLREATGQRGPLSGELFETLVVIEVHKWLRTMGRTEQMRFYRTRSGLELDLLLGDDETGWLGLECKMRDRAHPSDLRAMKKVADALGAGWRGGLLVHRGTAIELLDADRSIWGVPVHRLF